jgi:hypothetical protein
MVLFVLSEENGRLAPIRAALAEQSLSSIRRDGLHARLGAHWEGGLSVLCVAFWRSTRGMIEWLCTQGRWNPGLVIIFCTAARYRRATASSSHDDAHLDDSALHTGLVRPHFGFVGSLFFISPRTGHS